MKLLKIIGVILLVVIVILFFALPTELYVKSEIMIKKDTESVFNQINTLKNWQKWSPWQALDSNMINEYAGPESGVNAENIFKSENDNVGNGMMRILESVPNSYINIGLFFEDMSDNKTPNLTTNFSLVKISDEITQVTWVCVDTIGYFSPFRIVLPFMSVVLNDMFKDGLNRLKTYCESINERIVDVELSEGISPKFRLISVSDTSSTNNDEIKKSMNSKIVKLVEYMKESGIKGKNTLFTIQVLFDKENDKSIYKYGFPIDSNIVASAISKEYNVIEIGGEYAVFAKHTGPLRTINQAHIGIKKYIELKQYKVTANPYQNFITNPDEVGEWDMVSEVVYPVIKN